MSTSASCKGILSEICAGGGGIGTQAARITEADPSTDRIAESLPLIRMLLSIVAEGRYLASLTTFYHRSARCAAP
jgi:hypothetical protein